jgi:hypothetical protein
VSLKPGFTRWILRRSDSAISYTPSGACCIVGECSYITELDCDILSGTYLGNGAPCDGNPCPTGACCNNESCTDEHEYECMGPNVVYRGDGTACTDSPPPCTPWACCVEGACTMETLEDCNSLGGYWHQGDECGAAHGDLCGGDPCTSVSGECCTEHLTVTVYPFYNYCCCEWTTYNFDCDDGESCGDCRARAEADTVCAGCGVDNNLSCPDCADGDCDDGLPGGGG